MVPIFLIVFAYFRGTIWYANDLVNTHLQGIFNIYNIQLFLLLLVNILAQAFYRFLLEHYLRLV